MMRGHRVWGMVVVAALLVAACSDAGNGARTTEENETVPAGEGATSQAPGEPDGAEDTTTAADGNPAAPRSREECPPPPDGVPWTESVTATSEILQERSGDAPGVEAVVYPRPSYEGRPWSQWGQGIILDDGRFLSAIGDHRGPDGNSFIYEYDPATATLTEIADALSLVDHVPGEFGFGKIHAPMVAGPCGEVYTSTYWGSRRGLAYNENYQGDLLIRLDPEQRIISSAGVLLPEHGAASMASWPEGGLVYAEPADPFGQKTGSFVVLDAISGETVFEEDDDAHDGYRAIAVDTEGRAYIAWGGNGLARYDPTSGTLEPLDVSIPGGTLRTVTGPDGSGTIYGVSRESPTFFAFDPDGSFRELGPSRGYTGSMALAPEGDRFFYIPHAHGGAWEQGTPLIAVDTETGAEEVIVELNPIIEDHLELRTGGTYSVTVDPSGDRIYVGLNAGDPTSRDTFGEVILVIVTLP